MVRLDRIGLALGNGALRAIGLRNGVIVWAATGPLGDGAELEQIASELLAEAPRQRGRVGATLAVGPAHSQTRRISGLPPVRDARTVTDLVSQNVGRFFLKNGTALVSGGAVRGADDSWWAAAFEEPVVVAVTNACRKNQVRLESVQPAIALVSAALGVSELVWRDGAVVMSARWNGRLLAEVRRSSASSETPLLCLPPALAALGEPAVSYADAYAAALGAAAPEIPALRARARDSEAPLPRWRLITALTACLLSGTLALTAPVLGAYLRAVRAERLASALEPRAQEAFRVERELGRFRAALADFDTLAAGAAQPRSRLLALLAGSLPPEAALTAVRIDSSGGQLAVLAPRIAAVLDRLERSAWISAPQVVGPITRERSGDLERERATLKFVLP